MLKKSLSPLFPNQSSQFLIFFNALFLWLFFSFYRQYLDCADMVENYAWGITWTLGNNKHPPLFTWLTAAWFQIFPTSDWAYYLFNEVSLLIALVFLMLSMRKVFNEYQVFIALALTIVIFPLSIETGYKYNANLAQLPFVTGYIWALLTAVKDKRRYGYGLAGIFAGAAVLCKYSAVLLIAPITFAVWVYFKPKLTHFLPQLFLAGLVSLVVLSPHIYWEVQHHWPSIAYMHQRHPVAMTSDWFFMIGNNLIDIFDLIASPLVILGIALILRPSLIKTSPAAHRQKTRLGLLIFILSVLCIFTGASIEQIKPDSSWFIVCTIFFGWALVDILPETIKWDALKEKVKLLIVIFYISVTIVAIYIKNSHENSSTPLAALPGILAKDVTTLYHSTYNKPIEYTAGSHPLPYYLSFYSPDHPYGVYGLDIQGSNWINIDRFRSKGKVIVCSDEKQHFPKDPDCTLQAISLLGQPDSQRILKYMVYDPRLKVNRSVKYNVLMYK